MVINQYPFWKYIVIVAVLLVGALYSLPNLYGEDPAVQVSVRSGALDIADTRIRIAEALRAGGIESFDVEPQAGRLLIRFTGTEDQLSGRDLLAGEALGSNYVTALNLAPATPKWLRSLNAAPMYLGLDLRGGVHFLMQVDMETAVAQAEERYVSEIRTYLREQKIRYLGIRRDGGRVETRFKTPEIRDQALAELEDNYRDLIYETGESDRFAFIYAALNEEAIRLERDAALEQNIITLRNRVNELGVAEPIVQRQGSDRIVVQLPGVQDTTEAKRILGATATLEYRMVHGSAADWDAASSSGNAPVNARLYRERNGSPVLLERRVIVTGDQIKDASAGFDQQTGQPAVFVTLDGKGAKRMQAVSSENIGRLMAVVFIENRVATQLVDGELKKERTRVEEVINMATIRDVLSNRFQTTGLDSNEARDLALLLRAGSLRAPVEIIEERTVGPSLGQDNIDQGRNSVLIGFVLVLIFMGVYYKVFGLVANLALFVNLVLIVAVLSLFQATLTLPGIAGIVLTVGMAVDANVLIFERIREEIRVGNSPQRSIEAGYAKALSTIADANITTFIAAILLFGFGTGPIKGFAVTLSIGIVTSMFTAIMVTRLLVVTWVRKRRPAELPI